MTICGVIKAFVITLLLCTGQSSALNRFTRQSLHRGVTNLEIDNSIQRLEKTIRILENKLSRHEFREAQVADFSTKTLNALTADHGLNQKNMRIVAKQLGTMEERLLSLEALIKTIDERQRKKLDSLGDGINRLILSKPQFDGGLPPFPGENPVLGKEIKKVLRKITNLEGNIQESAKGVDTEVKIVGESMMNYMGKLNEQQQRLLDGWDSYQKNHLQAIAEVSSSLSKTEASLAKQVSEAKKVLGSKGNAGSCSGMNKDIMSRLTSLDKSYRDQEKDLAEMTKNTVKILDEQNTNIEYLVKESDNGQTLLKTYFGDFYKNLKEFDVESKEHLQELVDSLHSILNDNSKNIEERMNSLSTALDDKSTNILNVVKDSAGLVNNMRHSLLGNFEDLTKNVQGLKKVEQVMLNTADAVLDTKRSIEFGIQQVILELSDTVKNSGRNIDLTLSDHINNISFAILKNQTLALTNMTKKMEDEISQVWRQIGIMYQQISHSVNILDELQSTTSHQMNASLDKVDTMDGTVGAINNKVADVEDNLNYLLGRLSLVVSEFSHMKNGVGSELEKLREMAEQFSKEGVVEYEVTKKRSVQPADFYKLHDDRKTYF